MSKLVEDMPHLRKRLAVVDAKRLGRIKEASDNRNIRRIVRMWADEKFKPKVLSAKQRLAIHYLSDFTREFSYKWIATKINVQETKLLKWRNDPLFLRELDKELTRRITSVRVHAFRNVNRAVMRGSMKDTWKYLEMTGDLKKQVEFNDRTGEKELSDAELEQEIAKLSNQLTIPSSN